MSKLKNKSCNATENDQRSVLSRNSKTKQKPHFCIEWKMSISFQWWHRSNLLNRFSYREVSESAIEVTLSELDDAFSLKPELGTELTVPFGQRDVFAVSLMAFGKSLLHKLARLVCCSLLSSWWASGSQTHFCMWCCLSAMQKGIEWTQTVPRGELFWWCQAVKFKQAQLSVRAGTVFSRLCSKMNTS